MSDGVLALFGVLLGAFLTGGANWLATRQAELVRGRTAAAVLDAILRDAELSLLALAEYGGGGAPLDAEEALQAWREHRADLALFVARFNDPQNYDAAASAFRQIGWMQAEGYLDAERDEAITERLKHHLEASLPEVRKGANALRAIVLGLDGPGTRARR